MYEGTYPSTTLEGQTVRATESEKPGSPMFSGVRPRLVEFRGDWKQHVQTFRLASFYTCNNICHACAASKVDERVLYSDFARQPAWQATIWSQRDFVLTQLGHPLNTLTLVAGWHYTQIRFCSMHSVQLGIGLFSNGGAFFELLAVGWFEGADQAAKFRWAFASFKKFLKDRKLQCSQPVFKPWMFVTTGQDYCFFGSKARRLKFKSEFYLYSRGSSVGFIL